LVAVRAVSHCFGMQNEYKHVGEKGRNVNKICNQEAKRKADGGWQ
jgi:hypothetical protein